MNHLVLTTVVAAVAAITFTASAAQPGNQFSAEPNSTSQQPCPTLPRPQGEQPTCHTLPLRMEPLDEATRPLAGDMAPLANNDHDAPSFDGPVLFGPMKGSR